MPRTCYLKLESLNIFICQYQGKTVDTNKLQTRRTIHHGNRRFGLICPYRQSCLIPLGCVCPTSLQSLLYQVRNDKRLAKKIDFKVDLLTLKRNPDFSNSSVKIQRIFHCDNSGSGHLSLQNAQICAA